MILYRSRQSVVEKYLRMDYEQLSKERNKLNRTLQSIERQKRENPDMWIEDQDIIYDWAARDLVILSIIFHCKGNGIEDETILRKKIQEALPPSFSLFDEDLTKM